VKQCPVCSRTYFDDSLSYCLADGTLLTEAADPAETATFARPAEEPTVVRDRPGTAVPVAAKSSGGMKVAIAGLVGVVLLLFLVVVVLLAVMWIRGRQDTSNSNSNANQVALLPGASPTSNSYRSTPVPAPTSSAVSTPLSPPPTPVSTPPPDQRITDIPGQARNFKDPGTSRLKFRSGSVGETFRGTVSRQRSFVLRTLYGQYLTASIRSNGACVIFRQASTEIAFTTSQGDTSLTVVNTCAGPQEFTMSVTVR